MLSMLSFLLLASLSLVCSTASDAKSEVLEILNSMKDQVMAENNEEELLHQKYMSYCRSNIAALQASIDEVKKQTLPNLIPVIKTAESEKVFLDDDIKKHDFDRMQVIAAEKEASSIRQEEHTSNEFKLKELVETSSLLKSSLEVLGSNSTNDEDIIQAKATLRGLVAQRRLSLPRASDDERQQVATYLAGSDHITRKVLLLLTQAAKAVDESVFQLQEREAVSSRDFEIMTASKNREGSSLLAAVQAESLRDSELAMKLVELNRDEQETNESLREDSRILADLEKSCKDKEEEWDELVTTRNDELLAIYDAIDLLDKDLSRGIARQTLSLRFNAMDTPLVEGLSMLQLADAQDEIPQSDEDQRRSKALATIMQAKSQLSPNRQMGLEFISLALQSRTVDQTKVSAMIKKLLKTLEDQQVEEEKKHAYCSEEYKKLKTEDEALALKSKDLKAEVNDIKATIKMLKQEKHKIRASVHQLDASMDEAKEQREAQRRAFVELKASTVQTRTLLQTVKDRLHEFYDKPKPHPKFQSLFGKVAAHFNIPVNSATTSSSPETIFRPKSQKRHDAQAVFSLIEKIADDVEKELHLAELEESRAQEAFEKMLEDAKQKRWLAIKSLTEKEATKAEEKAEFYSKDESAVRAQMEKHVSSDIVASLHSECDELLKDMAKRREDQRIEIGSLRSAKELVDEQPRAAEAAEASRHLRGQA